MERKCKLNTLCLSWNGIGDLDPTSEEAGSESLSHELVEMLANTKALTELDLSHCRIGSSLGISASQHRTPQMQIMHTHTHTHTQMRKRARSLSSTRASIFYFLHKLR